MSLIKTYYLTTPIYYVNDAPHIGHAYTTLACDALARFKRLDGYNVKFLTGTDEHGQKVEKSAKAAGVNPKAFTDNVSQNFRDLANLMNFSHDDFIRTTEKRHLHSVQSLWKKLLDKDEIYLDNYCGWYAVRDEAFYDESELKDSPDGKKIAPSGAEVEWVEEPSYFFKLSSWGEHLLDFYDKNPSFIAPESRRNEVISFVKSGLRDLSISRTTFNWGIKVPGNEEHIVYVWLDALTNYITSIGFPDTTSKQFSDNWPCDLHMVGKDILRFHAVYWPAFLLAAGLKPPKRIFAHGWWTNEGEKISKSLGNIIDPVELVDKYGLDQVRYFLLREVPFGKDGDFSHRSMVNRMNGDLSNDLGNLAQRVLSMVFKNCDERVPEPGRLLDVDNFLLGKSTYLIEDLRIAFDSQLFHKSLERIWELIRAANSYVDAQAPWALKKRDSERMCTVLYVLCEILRRIAIILQPFMPNTMSLMLDQLSIEANKRTFFYLGDDHHLVPGQKLPEPKGLFPRFVMND